MWSSTLEVFVPCVAITALVAVLSLLIRLVYAFREVGELPDDPLDAEMASWSRLKSDTPEPREPVTCKEFGISDPCALVRRNAVRKVHRPYLITPVEALSDKELRTLLRQAKHEIEQRAIRRREPMTTRVVPPTPPPLDISMFPTPARKTEV